MNIYNKLENYNEQLEIRISNLYINRGYIKVLESPIRFIKNISVSAYYNVVYNRFNRLYKNYKIDANTYNFLISYNANVDKVKKSCKKMTKSFEKVNNFVDNHK